MYLLPTLDFLIQMNLQKLGKILYYVKLQSTGLFRSTLVEARIASTEEFL